MLSPSRLQSIIDELVAAHGRYRPVDLLLKIGRVPYRRYEAWRHGELEVLEQGMAGDPEQAVTLLNAAADCARQLGLQAESADDTQRVFSKSHYNRLARTHYTRPDDSPQLSLFHDTNLLQARKRLLRALLERNTVDADKHLGEMGRMDPDNDLQADAEFAVEALGWLEKAPDDPAGLSSLIESELAPRARNLLDADAGDFLAPFRRHLSEHLPTNPFDPENPKHHPSWALMQIPDWPAVTAAVLTTENFHRQPILLDRLVTSSLELDETRDTGVRALFELCWYAPEFAEAWLESTTGPALSRVRDKFWDFEPPLKIVDFPGWLAATGFPLPGRVPGFPDDQQGPASRQAYVVVAKLRAKPDEMGLREWLKDNHPRLFQVWLRKRQTP